MKTATLIAALVASLFLGFGAAVQAYADARELLKEPELKTTQDQLIPRTVEVFVLAIDLKVRFGLWVIGWGAVAIGSAIAFVASLLALLGGG